MFSKEVSWTSTAAACFFGFTLNQLAFERWTLLELSPFICVRCTAHGSGHFWLEPSIKQKNSIVNSAYQKRWTLLLHSVGDIPVVPREMTKDLESTVAIQKSRPSIASKWDLQLSQTGVLIYPGDVVPYFGINTRIVFRGTAARKERLILMQRYTVSRKANLLKRKTTETRECNRLESSLWGFPR